MAEKIQQVIHSHGQKMLRYVGCTVYSVAQMCSYLPHRTLVLYFISLQRYFIHIKAYICVSLFPTFVQHVNTQHMQTCFLHLRIHIGDISLLVYKEFPHSFFQLYGIPLHECALVSLASLLLIDIQVCLLSCLCKKIPWNKFMYPSFPIQIIHPSDQFQWKSWVKDTHIANFAGC